MRTTRVSRKDYGPVAKLGSGEENVIQEPMQN